MATIGIDLTPLQGPHRMRGVGSVAINVMRHLSNKERGRHKFILYLHKENQRAALDLIGVDDLSNYEVRFVKVKPAPPPSIKTRAGLLQLPARLWSSYLAHRLGDKRITSVDGLDVFLQFEQDVIPPRGVRSVLIAYDLIPYILESDYLWNYKTARHQHHYSRRGALKAQLKRSFYRSKIKSAMNRAEKIIAISKCTEQDFIQYLGLAKSKIDVVHLGVSDHGVSIQNKPELVERYIGTSWGDIRVRVKLPNTPFLLFVGGVDPRRKLDDLVHAFNLLRAQGHVIHLVLAGDTLLGPNSIPNKEARRALLSSSYLDDIYMLGFIDSNTREWLYRNALAFVYPSKYEGFGLPILEAMQYGTPVITYRGSSIDEVGQDKVLYTMEPTGIAAFCGELINRPTDDDTRQQRIDYAKGFTWSKATNKIIKLILG